jgi:hypothetical protein
MKTIWKFPLRIGDKMLFMPRDAEMLAVQMQHGMPMLWAKLDPEQDKVHVKVLCVGTGGEAPGPTAVYLDTVQDGEFVWHFFMERQA